MSIEFKFNFFARAGVKLKRFAIVELFEISSANNPKL